MMISIDQRSEQVSALLEQMSVLLDQMALEGRPRHADDAAELEEESSVCRDYAMLLRQYTAAREYRTLPDDFRESLVTIRTLPNRFDRPYEWSWNQDARLKLYGRIYDACTAVWDAM